jgi:hypothetical protein
VGAAVAFPLLVAHSRYIVETGVGPAYPGEEIPSPMGRSPTGTAGYSFSELFGVEFQSYLAQGTGFKGLSCVSKQLLLVRGLKGIKTFNSFQMSRLTRRQAKKLAPSTPLNSEILRQIIPKLGAI